MKTAFPENLSRPLAAFLLLALTAAAAANGQISTPNQIVGLIKLTNTSLAVPGFSSGFLRAASIGTITTYNHSTHVTVNTSTMAEYEVTVEADPTGIFYRVYDVGMRLDSGGDLYQFAEQDTPVAVFPDGSPDVELDFAECAGIVEVHFEDQTGVPVTVDGGSIVAHRLPSNTIQARDFNLPPGTSTETLAIRGDGTDYRIDVTYSRQVGSDPFVDLIKIEGLCQELLTMGCEDVQPITCEVPVGIGPGPLAPLDLGEIIGEVDMLGEEEHRIPTDHTRMRADTGPFLNYRFHMVDNTPPVPPSSGAFQLQNLLRSDFVSPPQRYRVWGQMSFRQGNAYEYFLTPFLGSGSNPGVFVHGGPVPDDLADTFVMDPGFLDVDILLAGPPVGAQGSCLEDIVRDADNSDSDGIPNDIAIWTSSRVEAEGLDQHAAGATFSAVNGLARVGFSGAFDPVTNLFAGKTQAVIAGLKQEGSIWKEKLVLRFEDSGTPTVPEGYQKSTLEVFNRTPADHEIMPTVHIPVDHHYCFSEVHFTFTSAVDFFRPRLEGIGSFTGIDFQGNPADYGVSLKRAEGTPINSGSAANKGLVVLCTPAGSYTLTPFVISVDPGGGGVSDTELPPVTFSCGCGQVCNLTPAIQIDLDPVAECTSDGTLPVSGSVDSDVDVARIFYTVGGGAEVDVCTSNCGIDPSFTATVALSACDNEVTVTAVDVLGNEASVTSTVTFDAQPPVLAGCEPITVEIEPGETGAAVTFDVTATDDCSGPVSVDCDPPSGSFFPEGETEVTCTAVDACGGTSQCVFPVTVSRRRLPAAVTALQDCWTTNLALDADIEHELYTFSTADPIDFVWKHKILEACSAYTAMIKIYPCRAGKPRVRGGDLVRAFRYQFGPIDPSAAVPEQLLFLTAGPGSLAPGRYDWTLHTECDDTNGRVKRDGDVDDQCGMNPGRRPVILGPAPAERWDPDPGGSPPGRGPGEEGTTRAWCFEVTP